MQEEPGGEASPPDASALPIKIQAQDASQTDEISSTDTSQTHELRRSGRSRTFKVESAAEKSARAPKREATRKAATHEEPVTPSSEQGTPGADSVPEISSSIPPEQAPASSEAESNEIQNLIDSIIARKVSQPIPAPPVGDLPFSVPVPGAYQIDLRQGDKLILLSRTLSGLVDIIVVTLCGSACVLGADIVSGIVIVDRMSVLNYSILLTAIFFLYSLYFLGTANQTIGMMITELRVADDQRKRPTIGRILLRCVAFLISLLGLGIGLIWGFFDDESECLHDKISRTRVARLSWPPTPTQSP